MSLLTDKQNTRRINAPAGAPETAVGACGRSLVWLPDADGRLALTVEPPSGRSSSSCSKCKNRCPGHEIFADHAAETEPA